MSDTTDGRADDRANDRKHRRRDEAARWFAIQDRGALSLDERAALDAWRADPENRAALARAGAAWNMLEGARQTYRPHGAAANDRGSRTRTGLRIPRTAAIAACLVAMVAAGATWLLPSEAPWENVRTGVGEQRTLTLADGSVLHVNVATRLRARIDGTRREVELQDGEAEFLVAPDKARPFQIKVAGRRVRVVGTQFDIRSRDGATDIAVREGTVALTRPDTGQAEPAGDQLLLQGGEAVSYTSGQVAPVRKVPADRVAEWRLRVLSYEQATMREVVRDLNRYFPGNIAISDPRVGDRRLTLRLPIADRDQTLRTLQEVLQLTVEKTADGALLRAAVKAR